ncbi:MAG: hypothetical protein MR911_08290 [Spirochaetia bacterium]|nr:hypothetical protein [Spirochaetia bacterium]
MNFSLTPGFPGTNHNKLNFQNNLIKQILNLLPNHGCELHQESNLWLYKAIMQNHIEQKILGGFSISKPPVLAQGVASAETIRIFI